MAAAREAAPQRLEAPGVLFAKLSPGPGKPEAEVAGHQRARIQQAMVELVAARGFEAVTVRELTRLAGVSTRAFYRHYASKEECFVCVHQRIAMRMTRRLYAVDADVLDREDRVRAAISVIAEEVDRDPAAARLMLVDACTSEGPALEQVRKGVQSIERALGEVIGRDSGEVATSPLVTEGVVAGMVGVARLHLAGGRQAPLAAAVDRMVRWALACLDCSAASLEEFDCLIGIGGPEPVFSRPSPSDADEKGGAPAPDSVRALLLAAAMRLVEVERAAAITPKEIAAVAGVSVRSFETRFKSVAHCLDEALERRASEAIATAWWAGREAASPGGAAYRAIASLCAHVAREPAFARLCFDEGLVDPRSERRCQGKLLGAIRGLAEEAAGPAHGSDLSIDASVAAAWGLLRSKVESGEFDHIGEAAPTLSYLLLAPSLGPEAAISAMRDESSRDGLRAQARAA